MLDLDSTDIALHGEQEERFFHGYYGHYCYLPLYIVCGEHVLCARLRPSNIDGAKGSVAEVERIVEQIRQAWPQVRIIVRGDSGFCRDELMSWCEAKQGGLCGGLGAKCPPAAGDRGGRRTSGGPISADRKSGAGVHRVRLSNQEKLVASTPGNRQGGTLGERGQSPVRGDLAEPARNHLPAPSRWGAQSLYEEFYCARGEMENRIKEQMMLFADRTSTSWLRSNQIRLYFSTVAYLLMQALRRLGLAGTELAKAQCNTVRLKLLKIGAQIRITVRKIWVSLSTGYPYLELFRQVHRQLQVAALRC